MKKRPNFFLIGAPKAGTTSLYAHLERHPDIFLTTPKEPAYFCENMNWTKGIEWYESLFQNVDNEKIIGEGSTYYSSRPAFDNVAEKIASYSADARFLYVIRDPVERAISHYWYRVQRHMESRPMREAFATHTQYVQTSNYAYQLEPYIDLFGLGRIKVITYESLFADPVSMIEEIFTWLGVDESVKPEGTGDVLNRGKKSTKQIRGKGMLFRFRKSLAWEVAGKVVPSPVRKLGWRLATKDVKYNGADRESVVAAIKPTLKECTKVLSDLLEREFPEWTELNRTIPGKN